MYTILHIMYNFNICHARFNSYLKLLIVQQIQFKICAILRIGKVLVPMELVEEIVVPGQVNFMLFLICRNVKFD